MFFCVLCQFVSVLFCKFVETFVKGTILLRPLWPFDGVLNIMLCFFMPVCFVE